METQSFVAWALLLVGVAGCSSDGEPGAEGEPEPPRLVAEAGFVEVPPGDGVGLTVPSRMFYSFHPAEAGAEDAPLLVFFNGGPGSATTKTLWAYGTGPYAINPAGEPEEDPRPNPDSYTRFANLLHIDSRGAGFSYEMGERPATECQGNDGHWMYWDASDFVMTLLEFVDAHDLLLDNPVVLVSESWGGVRGNLMLSFLQHYAVPSESTRPDYPHDLTDHVPWLQSRVQAHFDRVSPDEAGRERSADEVATQFGWHVMIQPYLLPSLSPSPEDPDMAPYFANPGTVSGYDTRRSLAGEATLEAHSARNASHPESLALMLGVSLSEVAHLAASERSPAYRILPDDEPRDAAARESELREALGELPEADAYWIPFSAPCYRTAPTELTIPVFVELLRTTRTFITNSRYDAVVYGDGLRSAFEADGLTYDRSSPAGSPRPGVLRGMLSGSATEIRFPEYESGHEVTVGAPREFGEDLEAWLTEAGVNP